MPTWVRKSVSWLTTSSAPWYWARAAGKAGAGGPIEVVGRLVQEQEVRSGED